MLVTIKSCFGCLEKTLSLLRFSAFKQSEILIQSLAIQHDASLLGFSSAQGIHPQQRTFHILKQVRKLRHSQRQFYKMYFSIRLYYNLYIIIQCTKSTSDLTASHLQKFVEHVISTEISLQSTGPQVNLSVLLTLSCAPTSMD